MTDIFLSYWNISVTAFRAEETITSLCPSASITAERGRRASSVIMSTLCCSFAESRAKTCANRNSASCGGIVQPDRWCFRACVRNLEPKLSMV